MSLAQHLPGPLRSPSQIAERVAELFTPQVHSANAIDPEYWFAKLDNIGAPAICEMIARGALRADIAMDLKVPLTVLAEWCENNIGTGDMQRALAMHAEVCVMKARLLLSATSLSPTESAQAKLLADRLFLHAERLHRTVWAPTVRDVSTPAAVMVNVNIPGYGQGPAIGAETTSVVMVDHAPDAPVQIPQVIPSLLPTQGRRTSTPLPAHPAR